MMKTYVLMLSKAFPAHHSKAGEPTDFVKKVLLQKKHTIRGNYELWKKRFEEIERGEAYLSVREWTGKPYRSKQREVCLLSKKSNGIGIQRLDIGCDRISVDGHDISLKELAANDGLSLDDWREWFKEADLTKPLAIIHFTKFRYGE